MRNKQRGLSIVELMVALVLSLVVMLVTVSIYVSNKQTYRFIDSNSLLQENGRFAIHFLRESAQQAGYPKNVSMVEAFPAATLPTDGGIAAGIPGSDAFTVNYWGQNDCLGNAPATATLNASGDRLIEDTFTVGANGLMCDGNGGAVGATLLVDGIDNMQIEYGLDTDVDGIANSYATAAEVTAATLWDSVVSMRIALLVSANSAVMDQDTPVNFRLLNNAPYVLTDQIPRRVFTTTIPLRNRNKVFF